MKAPGSALDSIRVFVADVGDGFFEITHNGFALLGLAVVFGVFTLFMRPDLRDAGEQQLIAWVQARQIEAQGLVPDLEGIARATATDPDDLPTAQAQVAHWLSRKYRVAPEPISALVAEAYEQGARAKLDPTLILAVMAVESGFNPFAQSAVGAQGLMQVMTKVHGDKYNSFGGKLAAFDPLSNLRVGVRVLQECIKAGGSIEAGLKYYVGAAHLPDDSGYAEKVLAEHARLKLVAAGRKVLPTASVGPAAPSAASPAEPMVRAEKVAAVAY